MLSAFLKSDQYFHFGIFLLLSILSGFLLLNYSLDFVYILPGIAFSALLLAIFLRNPVYFLYVYLVTFTLHFDNEPGIQLTDLIFFGFTLVFLIFYFFPYLLTGRAEIDNNIDKWYLLLIISIVYGFILGLFSVQNKGLAISDMTYFLGLWLFFPIKYHFKSKQFQKVVLYIFLAICLFVLIRNFQNYREIVIQANVQWQVQKARVAMNEIIILAGTIITMLGFSKLQGKPAKLISFFFYALFMAGLILTQSRGYWIGFISAAIAIFFVSDKTTRKFILYGNLILIILGIFTALVFFNNIFMIVMKAMAARWDSISTLSSTSHMGSSLLERVLETKAILSKLLINPIAGYGMGAIYHRYSVLFGTYTAMTYIHNGYLAIWFKTGIIGLIASTFLCISCLSPLRKIAKVTDSQGLKIISLSAFGLVIGMLIVNITSAQFLSFDSLMVLALIAAFASYYKAHWLPEMITDQPTPEKS